jgi:hypothetical protein
MTDKNMTVKLMELSSLTSSNNNNNNNNTVRISETPESLLSNFDNIYPLTKEDLLYNLKDYDRVISFLYYTSLLPPDNSKFSMNELKKLSIFNLLKFFGYIIYYILSRLSFYIDFYVIVYEVYAYFLNYFDNSEDLSKKDYFILWVTIIEFTGLILQQGVSILSIYILNNKLRKKSAKMDIPFYFQVLPTCNKFIIISSLSCVVFVFLSLYNLKIYHDYDSIMLDLILFGWILVYYNVFITIFIQGAILLFVLVDTHVSVSIVEDLLRSAKDKSLTMDKIYWARKEIERRVKSSFFITTIIVVVTFMNIGNILCICIYIFKD